jgi:hypothetical protein
MEKIKCYELKQIMHQSDEQFVDILSRLWTIAQLRLDVNTINNQCFYTPSTNPNFPYLFYMKEAKQKHNESTFLRSEGMDSYCMHNINIMIHVFYHFK